MSTVAVAPIDVDALIPDSIDPVEMHRVWRFDGKKLCSLNNGEAWEPGSPFAAQCRAQDGLRDYRFVLVRRGGMSLEQAQAQAPQVFRGHLSGGSISSMFMPSKVTGIAAPHVEPPEGYGYQLEQIPTHAAPEPTCSCGIYAATDTSHGYTGDVAGKVKMWGKIVPGEKGARAEYAYPSELHVPPRLADDPGILAYGVPVIVVDDGTVAFTPHFPARKPGMHIGLKVAIGMNLFATALNLSLLGFHVAG